MSPADQEIARRLACLPAGLEIPKDEQGPVFVEPWEARAFAMVVDLNARGRFAWKEFQALLVEEIGRSEREGLGRPYYLNWLIAAERLFETIGLTGREEVDAEVERLRPDDRTVRLR
ncbi:MAG: nitrile hydratase accessory protein [Hyphomicrobiaceae bacterium]